MESLCCWKTQRALCRCICVAFGQSWPRSKWQHYVIENLNNKLNGSSLIWMGDVAFHLDQSSFPLVTAPWTVFRWNAEDEWAQRGIHLFACWPTYIIYSLIIARHAHIHNLHLLYFQIFHISRLRVIIHFSTTPVHRSFVVFVWIFNVWRWSTWLQHIKCCHQMIGDRRKLQHSISADLLCSCLWAVFSAKLRMSHSSNSNNYIFKFLASEVLQKVSLRVCVAARMCRQRLLLPKIVFLSQFLENLNCLSFRLIMMQIERIYNWFKIHFLKPKSE